MNQEYIQLRQLLCPLYGEAEARAIALLVMEEAFGLRPADIYAGKGSQFSIDERARYKNMCARLQRGEPVQYVLGSADFMGRSFQVDSRVLIPRPETAGLVELARQWALQRLVAAPDAPFRLLDAGTGSGCIAVTLSLELPAADVTAWDLSAGALEVARANAAQLGANVHYQQRDLLQVTPCTTSPFHLIVSNPPYICQSEEQSMEAHVLQHEPHTALFVPDADPLRFYRALVQQAAAGWLAPGGALMVEINRCYGAATVALFQENGFQDVQLLRDCFENERNVVGIFQKQ